MSMRAGEITALLGHNGAGTPKLCRNLVPAAACKLHWCSVIVLVFVLH